jgi:hypothetical protein
MIAAVGWQMKMSMCFHWASQTLLMSNKCTQPHVILDCLCYSMRFLLFKFHLVSPTPSGNASNALYFCVCEILQWFLSAVNSASLVCMRCLGAEERKGEDSGNDFSDEDGSGGSDGGSGGGTCTLDALVRLVCKCKCK